MTRSSQSTAIAGALADAASILCNDRGLRFVSLNYFLTQVALIFPIFFLIAVHPLSVFVRATENWNLHEALHELHERRPRYYTINLRLLQPSCVPLKCIFSAQLEAGQGDSTVGGWPALVFLQLAAPRQQRIFVFPMSRQLCSRL